VTDPLTARPVLGELHLPATALGIESRRERAAMTALPPISYLHIWWARRPLVASAGVVLAGVMPAWTPELSAKFPNARELADEDSYRNWLLRLVGIWGDPVRAAKSAAAAKASGTPLAANPFTYKQAYRNHPDHGTLTLLHAVLLDFWGEVPLVCDLTAGGGSIPLAAARLGMRTHANDLNSVASMILKAGVEMPAKLGAAPLLAAEKYGRLLCDRMAASLAAYFPSGDDGRVTNYVWAHTVTCPRTGKEVPLVPSWSLRTEKGKEVAVRLITERHGVPLDRADFEIAERDDIDFNPEKGSVSRGDALSPWDHQVIDGDYIKAEARAHRLGRRLYAVLVRRPDGTRVFRVPSQADLDAVDAAEAELARVRHAWENAGFLPTETVPPGNDVRVAAYDVDTWADMFSSRQLLVHGTFAAEYAKLVDEVQEAMPEAEATAVLLLLGLMQGKTLDYNSRLATWQQARQVMGHVFQKHAFTWKWTFAEMQGAHDLYPWALGQVLKSYREIAKLYDDTGYDLNEGRSWPREVTVTQGSGADVPALADGSVAHLCMDPPYYDNVMYAELSDFFYVWEKRTVGRVLPELFPGDLADKENEAVANVARFASMGKRKKALAEADYEAKMTAIFTEAKRALRDDGVLTVMFTHKRAEAWDTLGMGLLKAGFTIEASWPVNTESETSLHQAGLNSAASTIMLVCRKRATDRAAASDVYLEDIEGEVRAAARDAVERFRADGIDGVDLLLSAYGPTLAVVSQHWPVHSSEADEDGRARLLRPEEALSIARSEIVLVQRARLVGHPIEFDPLTDFVVAFWDVMQDDVATFDEGRRLALAVGGLDIDELQRAKILEKKAGVVRLLDPKERLRPRAGDDGLPGVRPQAESFANLIDAVHTVCLVAEEDGLAHAKALMDRGGLAKQAGFMAAVQALVNSVPRAKAKGVFVLPLAGALDRVVTAYLPGITVPADPVEEDALVQGDLFANPVA
jgi:putative DNA methylase